VVPYDILPAEIHVFHLAMCHTVPRPVYFTWQCVIRYHNQCISRGNVTYGTTTSVFHLAMCYTVPQPVYFTWQCVIRYHDQCISPGNVLYGTTTNVNHLAMCYTVPRPVYFTWQYVILVVVPYNTLPCGIHWSWYRITHCQVKYNGCGTA
jgi:hypothetical protein